MVIQDMEAAQQAVLGAMLIQPSLVGEVLAQVQDRDFVNPRHRMTYQAIRSLFGEGKESDPVAVLHQLGHVEQQPWREYIIDLMDKTPTAANIWEYVPILKEQARLYYVTAANNGYSGDLEIAVIPDSYRKDVLGEKEDETDNILVENVTAEPKPHALLFEFAGDQKAVRHVLYNCAATRPGLTGATTNKSKEPTTEKITLTASPLPNGNIKAKTTPDTPDEKYQNWYKTVWQPAEPGVGG